MSGYNDWESDLSSIIEKTNQNLKLLRRIGDKRADITSGDVSTTSARPASSAAQIASEMRSFASSISNRYAAEDNLRSRHASTTSVPRGTTTSSTRKINRSSSVEVGARDRARESLIIRPAAAAGVSSDGEAESDERSPRIRHVPGASSGSRVSSTMMKRSSSLGAKAKSSSTRTSLSAGQNPSVSNNAMGTSIDGGALDVLRKSLEVHIASRSSAFEKALSDLKTDCRVVSTETNSLAVKMNELRDSVTAKLSTVSTTAQTLVENGESIARLEKHSAVLLGWKVGVDQDLFEISTKLKSFTSIQEKMTSLEGHVEALGNAIKTAHRTARYDEKIEELKDRISTLERQAANQLDSKAVEHTVQMRVSKEINELENRFNQSLQFLTQKIENKLQTVEKSIQSDRIDAITSLKNDFIEDLDKLEGRVVKKVELAPFQNAHTLMKDDITHMQLFFERQDKRFQELKQNSSQIRGELVETRHELTKALHAQQSRVSSTLEEKVAQMAVTSKEKNTKADQKVSHLEKRCKKVEEQCKSLQDMVARVKQDVLARQAADTVAQQRENERLRQRLMRSVSELEQLQVSKLDVERSYEAQERQYQAKMKELKVQIEELARGKDAERAELIQSIQTESRQSGVAQGRNLLLESLLAREKHDNEEKSQEIQKARQEIAQIRQKMRSLESEVDKKMQRLSNDLQSKQSQVDLLTKKLAKSEGEALKHVESSKREKKLIMKTKELKQQELVIAKARLRELEKSVLSLLTKHPDIAVAREEDDSRLLELESKRKELELMLAERESEVREMKSDLEQMQLERNDLNNKHTEDLQSALDRLSGEYEQRLEEVRRSIASKDEELIVMRESLVEKSAYAELEGALSQARREHEHLLDELRVSQADQKRLLSDTEANLTKLHASELDRLQEHLKHRVEEITRAEKLIEESNEKVALLETEIKNSAELHGVEITKLVGELKEAKSEVERICREMDNLNVEKSELERQLSEMRTALETISAGDDELLEEVDNLRLQHDDLSTERERLIESLKEKTSEVAELTQLDEAHRATVSQLMREQDDSRARMQLEIGSIHQTLEQERDAAATSANQLRLSLETLQDELQTLKSDGTLNREKSAKFEAEVRNLQHQLTSVTESEEALKDRLRLLLGEFSHDDLSERDPVNCLRVHVTQLREKLSEELASLSSDHELTVKEVSSYRSRVQDLENQIEELSSHINDLEKSNIDLKCELEKLNVEQASLLRDTSRLQDEISTVTDKKELLQEQVEEQLAQIEELESAMEDRQREKDGELKELKDANSTLLNSITEIKETMEYIEASKIAELDNMNAEAMVLEAKISSLAGKITNNREMAMEKEMFANQQAIVTAGQNIRTLYAKLSSGCSVVEMQELKSSILALENKHSKTREDFRRDRRTGVEADEAILLDVEFLEALIADDSSKERHPYGLKYIQAAPALVTRLRRLQDRYAAALHECCGNIEVTNHRDEESPRDEEAYQLNDGYHVYSNDGDEGLVDKTSDVEGDSDEDSEQIDASGSDLELSADDNDIGDSRADEDEEQTYGTTDGPHLDRSGSTLTQLQDPPVEEVSQPSDDKNFFRTQLSNSSLGEPLRHHREESSLLRSTLASSCTTSLHSPTAALLDQPSELRSSPVVSEGPPSVQIDDALVQPCTKVLHSPTAVLLQERFESRARCFSSETRAPDVTSAQLNREDGDSDDSGGEDYEVQDRIKTDCSQGKSESHSIDDNAEYQSHEEMEPEDAHHGHDLSDLGSESDESSESRFGDSFEDRAQKPKDEDDHGQMGHFGRESDNHDQRDEELLSQSSDLDTMAASDNHPIERDCSQGDQHAEIEQHKDTVNHGNELNPGLHSREDNKSGSTIAGQMAQEAIDVENETDERSLPGTDGMPGSTGGSDREGGQDGEREPCCSDRSQPPNLDHGSEDDPHEAGSFKAHGGRAEDELNEDQLEILSESNVMPAQGRRFERSSQSLSQLDESHKEDQVAAEFDVAPAETSSYRNEDSFVLDGVDEDRELDESMEEEDTSAESSNTLPPVAAGTELPFVSSQDLSQGDESQEKSIGLGERVDGFSRRGNDVHGDSDEDRDRNSLVDEEDISNDSGAGEADSSQAFDDDELPTDRPPVRVEEATDRLPVDDVAQEEPSVLRPEALPSIPLLHLSRTSANESHDEDDELLEVQRLMAFQRRREAEDDDFDGPDDDTHVAMDLTGHRGMQIPPENDGGRPLEETRDVGSAAHQAEESEDFDSLHLSGDALTRSDPASSTSVYQKEDFSTEQPVSHYSIHASSLRDRNSTPLSRIAALRSDSDEEELTITHLRDAREKSTADDEGNEFGFDSEDVEDDLVPSQSDLTMREHSAHGTSPSDEDAIQDGVSNKTQEAPHSDELALSNRMEGDAAGVGLISRALDGHGETDDAPRSMPINFTVRLADSFDEANVNEGKEDDFDRVLSAPAGDSDDALDQESSFDSPDHVQTTMSEHDPATFSVNDETNEFEPRSEGQEDLDGAEEEHHFDEQEFGEDSMDEVERLLLQHAETSENAVAQGGDRQFTSALRMEDDDELIDSESDHASQDDGDRDHILESQDDEDVLADSLSSLTKAQYAVKHIGDDRGDDDLDMDDHDGGNDDRLAAQKVSDTNEEDESDDELRHPSRVTDSFDPSGSHVSNSRVTSRNFDDSDEEQGERLAVPIPQPVSQLPPLSGMGGRTCGASGSGSLLKALNVSRMAMSSSDFDDDDMDEVEKLMSAKSFQKKSLTTQALPSHPISHHDNDHENDFDASADDDDDVDQTTTKSPEVEGNIPQSSDAETTVVSNESEATTKSAPDGENENEHWRLQDEDDISEHDDGDESMDDASATFGESFADDALERAMDGPTRTVETLPPAPSSVTINSRASRGIDTESDGDDEFESKHATPTGLSELASPTLLLGRGRQLGSLQPLPSLAKKPLPGLSALSRSKFMADHDDDDMDEVERLLLEQTSMYKVKPIGGAAKKSIADEDDFHGSRNDRNVGSPLKDPTLPIAQEEDDEFAHFDRDNDDEDESRGDLPSKNDREVSSSELSDSQRSAPSSPSRIPILPGSSLLKELSPKHEAPLTRPRMASAKSEDDGAEAYLEDSFDLEESLQEEEEDV